VIASLALFFIAHVAISNGAGVTFPANVDWQALLLAATAALALLRYKVGVIPVILACGLAGLVLRMLA
jgi:chromate transporter